MLNKVDTWYEGHARAKTDYIKMVWDTCRHLW